MFFQILYKEKVLLKSKGNPNIFKKKKSFNLIYSTSKFLSDKISPSNLMTTLQLKKKYHIQVKFLILNSYLISHIIMNLVHQITLVSINTILKMTAN